MTKKEQLSNSESPKIKYALADKYEKENKEIEDNYDNVNNPIPSGMLIGQDGKIVWKSGADETLEVALKRLINKS